MPTETPGEARDVLAFWFGEPLEREPDAARRRLWFVSSAESDRQIAARFGDLVERALGGELDCWQGSACGSLALVLLLDQFTRNIYRGSARAFSGDERARTVAAAALDAAYDRELPAVQAAFLYLPFEHHEDAASQARCQGLFEDLAARHGDAERELALDFLAHAREHRSLIERFGRFPHRNRLLGRSASAEEIDYLDRGGKTFGQ